MIANVAEVEEPIIHVEGVFDGIAARRLEAVLVRGAPGRRLEIDLTQVREFSDFAIAVLANALLRCGAFVSLRGLRLHQVRLLRYFGVDAGPLGRVALSDVG
jgi:anti-anti-sigma regulatory factor